MSGDHAMGNAMAKRSGGEKVSGPPGQVVPYANAAITKLSIRCTLVIRGRYVPVWAMAFLRPNKNSFHSHTP